MAQTVDPELAAGCVANYEKMYTSNDAALIQKAYTSSVSFPSISVSNFLESAVAVAETLEIKFGVYTAEFKQKYPEVEEGRLTVFLYTKTNLGLGAPPYDVYNTGTPLP
jgi:hypothetical protein